MPFHPKMDQFRNIFSHLKKVVNFFPASSTLIRAGAAVHGPLVKYIYRQDLTNTDGACCLWRKVQKMAHICKPICIDTDLLERIS